MNITQYNLSAAYLLKSEEVDNSKKSVCWRNEFDALNVGRLKITLLNDRDFPDTDPNRFRLDCCSAFENGIISSWKVYVL